MLAPRFQGPVMIAESSAGFTTEGYDHFQYQRVTPEHQPLQVSLVDLNEEGGYQTHTILNGDLHAVPVRLAVRLLDPEAYVICSCMLKTHNTVVATLSIKNMALGAPRRRAGTRLPGVHDERVGLEPSGTVKLVYRAPEEGLDGPRRRAQAALGRGTPHPGT